MKIWKFIKWHYRRLEIWQKIWLVGTMALGWGFAAPDHSTEQLIGYTVTVICIGGLLGKWMVWDAIRDSYAKFKEEEQGLLEMIKHSDERK